MFTPHRMPKKIFRRLWRQVWAKCGPNPLNTLDLPRAQSSFPLQQYRCDLGMYNGLV